MKPILIQRGRFWLQEYRMHGFYILPLLAASHNKGSDYFLGYLQIEAGWGKIRLVLNWQYKKI